MPDVQDAAVIRKRLGVKLREMRRYLRGEPETPPSPELVCVWIELASMLECYQDVLDLSARLFEADTDPWLYKRAQRLVRLAHMKVEPGHAG